jgi:hypothetical protein
MSKEMLDILDANLDFLNMAQQNAPEECKPFIDKTYQFVDVAKSVYVTVDKIKTLSNSLRGIS